jgi:hypothetical protein
MRLQGFKRFYCFRRFPLNPAEQVDLLWDAMSIEKRDKGWMQFAVLNAMHHCSSDFLKRMISEGEVGGGCLMMRMNFTS